MVLCVVFQSYFDLCVNTFEGKACAKDSIQRNGKTLNMETLYMDSTLIMKLLSLKGA